MCAPADLRLPPFLVHPEREPAGFRRWRKPALQSSQVRGEA